MRRILRNMGVLMLAGAGTLSVMASPADGRPQLWPQPDGSAVTLSLIGDEAFHCLMTPDGYIADMRPDGFYYFVGNDGKITDHRVSDGIPASLDKGSSFTAYKAANSNQAFLESRASNARSSITRVDKLGNSKWDNSDGHDLREVPTDGELRVLVILVDYQDKMFSVSDDPRQLISDMLNKEGFDKYESTGSAYDYFRDISNNQFHPKFDVYGPAKLSKPCVDYISTTDTYINEDGKPVTVYAPGRMIEEACRLLDDQINFADYDANNDGLVDFVYVFHAGKGATTGGNKNTDIWPHAFTLTSALGAPIELDGVKINRYATSCEIGNISQQLAGVGMFCHEFSHVLGLPDLYDTANNGSSSKVFSPGTFSNMDAGNYNNNLHTPPMYSSYEQYALEWMKPVTITGSGEFTLLPLTARHFAYKMNTRNNPMEYFLFEARAPFSWDEYLEGHGMLAWHIDYNERTWSNNTVNNTASRQGIDLLEADDNQTANSRAGDPFPGTAGIHELYSNSTPALAAWDKSSLGYEMTQIKDYPDGTISFIVEGSKEMEGVALGSAAPNVFDVTPTSASVYWPAVEGADGYYVSVIDLDSFHKNYYRQYADGWYFKDVKKNRKVNVEGLTSGKNYGVMVYAYNEVANSRMSRPVSFVTQGAKFEEAAPNISAYTAPEGGVELNWDKVGDATHYELTVATRKAGETAEEVKTSFDNSEVPEGWEANGVYETRDRYIGAASPCLSLKTSGESLTTPLFARDIKSVSFHNVLNYSEEACSIEVYGINADGHKDYLGEVTGLSNKSQTETFDVPAGYRQISLMWSSKVSGLYTYIDDVVVSLTDGPVDTPVSGYASKKVEDNSLVVNGLDPNTSYVAYVKPFNGEQGGKVSKAVFFTPSKVVQGVDAIGADSDYVEAEVSLINGEVTAYGAPLTVYSVDGKVIGQGTSVTLPSRGLYIVRTGESTKKICW